MRLSPNFGPRRDGLKPELVVIHYTAMEDADAAERVLCSPEREVSAHYLIRRNGEVTQLVEETQRAWHAGRGTWRGHSDVNSRSIGIELDNTGTTPFAGPLMNALETLLHGILPRWSIKPSGVIGHSCMAPDRKIDPGPRFDWPRLARQGLAIAPPPLKPILINQDQFLKDAAAYGFPSPFSWPQTSGGPGATPPSLDPDLTLRAFRLRFRQGRDTPLDGTDCAIAAWLKTQII